MFADPTTVGADSLAFESSGPFPGTVSDFASVVLNKVEVAGRKPVYRPPSATIMSLVLSKAEVTVSHQPTNQGRVRSLLRVDVSKQDANLKEHGSSVQLVVDTEAAVSSEQQLALRAALELFIRLIVENGESTDIGTTGVFSQFLNGES
jgi:hypothetical protein